MAENIPLERVPVLIVGGGIVGLSASLFLLQQGVPSLLVERHAGTSIHPRSRGINGRTAELYRELGVLEAVREAGAALQPAVGFLQGETLAGAIANVPRRTAGAKAPFVGMGLPETLSPATPCRCTQDLLEPVLLAAARERGGELRFRTELREFAQDDAGVTATIVDRDTGAARTVRADYVIAADGAGGKLRGELGIGTRGPGALGHLLNVLCRVDLRELVRDREFSLCKIERPELRALLISINNADRWCFHIAYDPARGESPADFPPERCAELLRTALGLPDASIEVLGILPWEPSVRVAQTFRKGRVFLAGDAAHQMPPWGGQGANTGIADVHNLAWKLAAVLAGKAAPALLDTYDVERQPVGYEAAVASGAMGGEHGLVNFAAMPAFTPEHLRSLMGFGYEYRSAAVVDEPDASSTSLASDEPDGRPGSRAPHAWVEREGVRVSTLDLFGRGFVLLAGAQGEAWCAAARVVAEQAGVALRAYRVGPDGELREGEGRFAAAAGVGEGGALLVRPDGFVAWRARGAVQDPERALADALAQVLGRAPYTPRPRIVAASAAAHVETVTSRDGTPVAFARQGSGPPLVLLHGALSGRAAWDAVAPRLASRFTVYAVDRRGRGASGDTAPYAVARELEDVFALLNRIAEPVHLLGHSSGALLALHVAERSAARLRTLTLYEPPLFASGLREPLPPELPAQLRALLARGERDEAVRVMLRQTMQLPEPFIAMMERSPAWPQLAAVAHTTPYDAQVAREYGWDPARLRGLHTPTLLLLGGKSPAWVRADIEAVAAALPDKRVAVLGGQEHMANYTAPQLLAREVAEFLAARGG